MCLIFFKVKSCFFLLTFKSCFKSSIFSQKRNSMSYDMSIKRDFTSSNCNIRIQIKI